MYGKGDLYRRIVSIVGLSVNMRKDKNGVQLGSILVSYAFCIAFENKSNAIAKISHFGALFNLFINFKIFD
jgi:hypothetical protein